MEAHNVWFMLSLNQLKQYKKAVENKTEFRIKLTSGQVASSRLELAEGFIHLRMSGTQFGLYRAAKAAGRNLLLTISKTAMLHRTGGILPLLIPLLLAASAPGLAASSGTILKEFKGGFDTLKSLVSTKGSSLQIHGGDVAALDDFVKGSSLKIFGEGHGNQKKMQPKPHEVHY